jgi:hypothetical protein
VTTKRGRPRLPYPTEKVDIRLHRQAFDAACREAQRKQKPLATLIRELLERRYLPDEKSESTAVH